jgi:hypothetical protein
MDFSPLRMVVNFSMVFCWTFSSADKSSIFLSSLEDHSYIATALFFQPQHFHEFFDQLFSSLCTKNFKLHHQNVMLKNVFCFDGKNSFCEKIGIQIKFCAITVLT